MAATIDPQAGLFASEQTNISPIQVGQVLNLMLVEECTVPFITRYRKERTGGLNEEQIRQIKDSYDEYLEREKRREYVLKTIKEMDKLTPELEKKILSATTINQLEDLYAPYKSKKKTKGQMAEDAGLMPLAEELLRGNKSIEEMIARANEFLNPEHKVTNAQEALEGAGHILIERFAHDVELKEKLRSDYWRDATLTSSKRKEADEVKDSIKFKDYFEFSQPIKGLKDPKVGHRVLALRRGMNLKILKVDVTYPEEAGIAAIEAKYFSKNAKTYDHLKNLARKAFVGSIHSSLDLEVKTELKKLADEAAIEIFKVNLKNLLLQPYLGTKAVLGVDPGVRTGCKIAVVDETGKFHFDTVIYPHEPQREIDASKKVLERLIDHFKIEHMAIGNGTFGRETLEFVQEHVPQVKSGKCHATLVNEAGASIYSASEIAAKEFPDKDATVRGAISIARRFQDPLAELVKIDPKSIGVGQYQHDVNQTKLKQGLEGVVEDCVNFVGVDVNTASAPLLSHISGIGSGLAENIVKFREEKGIINNRQKLLKVPRFSQKVFEQAAGFLRIYKGEHPLDATPIHPEKYSVIESWCAKNNTPMEKLVEDRELITKLEKDSSLKNDIGEFTFVDVVKALKAPGQDPRTQFKSTEFRKDISSMKDLVPGEWYPGIVTNITAFGAFVDIGIKVNGLVHVSEMADRFVDNALEVLKVGQEVLARVIEVDTSRDRISLSLKKGDSKSAGPRPAQSYSGDSRGKGRQQEVKIPAAANIKNNAFAALKDLKLK